MKRYTRTVWCTIIIVLGLLPDAPHSQAGCAWILWAQNQRGAEVWRIQEAYDNHAHCEAGKEQLILRIMDESQHHKPKPSRVDKDTLIVYGVIGGGTPWLGGGGF